MKPIPLTISLVLVLTSIVTELELFNNIAIIGNLMLSHISNAGFVLIIIWCSGSIKPQGGYRKKVLIQGIFTLVVLCFSVYKIY